MQAHHFKITRSTFGMDRFKLDPSFTEIGISTQLHKHYSEKSNLESRMCASEGASRAI